MSLKSTAVLLDKEAEMSAMTEAGKQQANGKGACAPS